jgi:hypothetical protein
VPRQPRELPRQPWLRGAPESSQGTRSFFLLLFIKHVCSENPFVAPLALHPAYNCSCFCPCALRYWHYTLEYRTAQTSCSSASLNSSPRPNCLLARSSTETDLGKEMPATADGESPVVDSPTASGDEVSTTGVGLGAAMKLARLRRAKKLAEEKGRMRLMSFPCPANTQICYVVKEKNPRLG